MPRSKNFDANEHLANALAAIDAQISTLQTKRNQLASIIGGGSKAAPKAAKTSGKPKRTMSPEARKKISDAQKKRWGTDKKKK
jgi:hypothetical protein